MPRSNVNEVKMVQKLRPSLEKAKTGLVRLVVQGPAPNPGALAIADKLLTALAVGAPAQSRAARLAVLLKADYKMWFGEDQVADSQAQQRQRAAMLMAIGEFIDLAARRPET
jgi:hypothetical protein